jgi:predicted small secreted protein
MPGWNPPDPAYTPGRIIVMRKKLAIALTLFALVGAAPLLAACHTTAGAGQDISATGHALTGSAQKNTP